MSKHPKTIAVAVAAALALLGCGSSSKPSTSATVGTAGATLKAGVATLSIPAGALSQDTQVTLREAEVRHSGRSVRVEMEPNDHTLAQPCKLSVQINDQNVKVKMLDDGGAMSQVEVEDRNHHQFKTTMSHLGEIEVELEHGTTCDPVCDSGQECDDGACKTHDEHATTCDPVCDSGQECDDGACKTHDEFETEHGGIAGTCTPACATGLECDASDGVCKPHGGTP
jgi:hypothetical protein